MQARLARSAAGLSILGALLVIIDNLRNRKRLSNLYNQIVAAMACFDIIYSITAAFLNIPRPADDSFSAYGEYYGNRASCTAQGWMYQWSGMTSLFFNASLSTYYVLVIVYHFRDSQLKRVRKYMFGIPVCMGLILACVSIPFISPTYNGCHLTPPLAAARYLESEGYRTTWASFLGLYIVPGYLVIAYATAAMLRIYMYVRKINKNSHRWDFSSSSNVDTGSSGKLRQWLPRKRTKKKRSSSSNKIQNEVFYQSVLYLAALYMSWFLILGITVNAQSYVQSHYGLWCYLFFIFPLQVCISCLLSTYYHLPVYPSLIAHHYLFTRSGLS
jgi:hypothetical protein